jgi:hypothetical protein
MKGNSEKLHCHSRESGNPALNGFAEGESDYYSSFSEVSKISRKCLRKMLARKSKVRIGNVRRRTRHPTNLNPTAISHCLQNSYHPTSTESYPQLVTSRYAFSYKGMRPLQIHNVAVTTTDTSHAKDISSIGIIVKTKTYVNG